MRRKAAGTAFELFRTGIAAKSSAKLSTSTPVLRNTDLLFSLFCSSLHNVCHKVRPFSSKRRVDFSSVNDVEDAVFLFGEMLRMQPYPSVVEFNKLLTAVVKMKDYSAALSLFDEMCQLGIRVDEYTLTIVINCYCLLNRADFGFAILGRLLKGGYRPGVTSFTALIRGLFLDGKVVQAEKLFKKLLTLKLCEPDEVLILTVINGLCKAGLTLTARDLLGLFEKTSYKPHVYSYNTVIDVKDLLHEMFDHKISLDVITFNILVDAFCKEGMVKKAEDVLDIMVQRNVCPDTFTYNTLIDGYCLQGQLDKARKIFDSLADRGLKPSIISYNSLVNGYCKHRMLDEAWRLFLEIPCKGLQHTTSTYNTILQGLFHEGQFDYGLKLFNTMENRQVPPDLQTYNILLDGLCRAKQISQAFCILRTMEDKGVNPDIVTYAILIDGMCKNGKCDTARNLLNQLPSKGLKPNVQIYTIIIDSLYQEGLEKEAKYFLMEMERSGCAPDSVTYNIIIRGLLKRNEPYRAMPFLEEMHQRGFLADSVTTSMLIDQLLRGGTDVLLLEMIKKIVPKV